MSDVLLIWDGRQANTCLECFVDELLSTLASYAATVKVVQLATQHAPEFGKIKPSMRALFNVVQQEKPKHLISFGSQPNLLVNLLRPTLKCEIICNRLPDGMHFKTVASSAMQRVSDWINYEHRWCLEDCDFFYLPLKEHQGQKVGYFEDDVNSVVFHCQADELGLCSEPLYPDLLQLRDVTGLHEVGLVMISAASDPAGNRVDLVNALGIPVVVVAETGSHLGVVNGYNGWVVSSMQGLPILQILKNWSTMALDMRRVLAQYAHQHQSKRSGIRHFCDLLGYPVLSKNYKSEKRA
ncbi:hypothetical protein FJM67_10245 [Maribrevibacterium harenarium]|uniref:Uncharacterized protein n=1 Tax=Maribrevibacterium harenarium TaxID=2589817 RepID=A0A501WLP4_9GAMM|nr:hypothetical protein [Maribrevibacterium harenarium]TPE50683.1 hypothetical protein FJM67_10245 [Maribrevibacterium harenarium]